MGYWASNNHGEKLSHKKGIEPMVVKNRREFSEN